MGKVLVVGHKNPDTDSIGSAIAAAYLYEQLGQNVEPVALGEVNDETAYALEYFGYEAPRVIESVDTDIESLILVDHNEAQQSVPGRENVKIQAVIDHHRVANFETADPLYYRAEPIGSTASILTKMFHENDIEIPKNLAGLMLSAVISDTLLLKSPTCTTQDVEIAKELAELAEVELETYGLDMLKAGTNVDDKTAFEILEDDAKSFEMGSATVRIGQVNVVDVSDVLSRKEELLTEMSRLIDHNAYELYVLLITNIIDSDTVALLNGQAINAAELAFDQIVTEHTLDLPGVVSRKKQVVPQLTEAFQAKK